VNTVDRAARTVTASRLQQGMDGREGDMRWCMDWHVPQVKRRLTCFLCMLQQTWHP
jgi:hypothetical protein